MFEEEPKHDLFEEQEEELSLWSFAIMLIIGLALTIVIGHYFFGCTNINPCQL